MPVRVRWLKGKQIGIAMIFFGIAGLFQALLIAHGQYLAYIGSNYVITLVPVTATICMAFAAGIIFEGLLQQQKASQHHRKYQKKFGALQQREILFPLLILLGSFAALYFAAFYLVILGSTAVISFVVAENVGSIGVLIIASLLENKFAPKAKPF